MYACLGAAGFFVVLLALAVLCSRLRGVRCPECGSDRVMRCVVQYRVRVCETCDHSWEQT